MEAITINLHKTGGYGKMKYIGMYNFELLGNGRWKDIETGAKSPERFFELVREKMGKDIEIIIKSEEIPKQIRDLCWFMGREIIGKEELAIIVTEQKNGGYNVKLG